MNVIYQIIQIKMQETYSVHVNATKQLSWRDPMHVLRTLDINRWFSISNLEYFQNYVSFIIWIAYFVIYWLQLV